MTTLKPSNIDLHISAPNHDEQVETWKCVFGIEERFKAKLCGHNEGKAWLVQVIDEAASVSMTPNEFLAAKRKTAAAQLFVDDQLFEDGVPHSQRERPHHLAKLSSRHACLTLVYSAR
jgi:hypothetical protein